MAIDQSTQIPKLYSDQSLEFLATHDIFALSKEQEHKGWALTTEPATYNRPYNPLLPNKPQEQWASMLEHDGVLSYERKEAVSNLMAGTLGVADIVRGWIAAYHATPSIAPIGENASQENIWRLDAVVHMVSRLSDVVHRRSLGGQRYHAGSPAATLLSNAPALLLEYNLIPRSPDGTAVSEETFAKQVEFVECYMTTMPRVLSAMARDANWNFAELDTRLQPCASEVQTELEHYGGSLTHSAEQKARRLDAVLSAMRTVQPLLVDAVRYDKE